MHRYCLLFTLMCIVQKERQMTWIDGGGNNRTLEQLNNRTFEVKEEGGICRLQVGKIVLFRGPSSPQKKVIICSGVGGSSG
jgi:hypothetical protein